MQKFPHIDFNPFQIYKTKTWTLKIKRPTKFLVVSIIWPLNPKSVLKIDDMNTVKIE